MADGSMFLGSVTHSLMDPLVRLTTRPSDQNNYMEGSGSATIK